MEERVQRQVLHHAREPPEPEGPQQPGAPGDQATLWRGRSRPALHRLGSAGTGKSARMVHPAALQHDRT